MEFLHIIIRTQDPVQMDQKLDKRLLKIYQMVNNQVTTRLIIP
jgi:hypothetical protein